MSRFQFVVTVECDTADQADTVMLSYLGGAQPRTGFKYEAWVEGPHTPGHYIDRSSSVSRQHYIDTGRYLTYAEVAAGRYPVNPDVPEEGHDFHLD